jgi:hypothetical protein
MALARGGRGAARQALDQVAALLRQAQARRKR